MTCAEHAEHAGLRYSYHLLGCLSRNKHTHLYHNVPLCVEHMQDSLCLEQMHVVQHKDNVSCVTDDMSV